MNGPSTRVCVTTTEPLFGGSLGKCLCCSFSAYGGRGCLILLCLDDAFF